MTTSIFDLFSIGIGPSSSHTVGPMLAAKTFVTALQALDQVDRVLIEIYGSLALTGHGHNTDLAILNGLEGKLPQTADPDQLRPRAEQITQQQMLMLKGAHEIEFILERDLVFHKDKSLEKHSNGMRLTVFAGNKTLASTVYYSIGGGFIVTEEDFHEQAKQEEVPYPFCNAAELFAHCREQQLTIAELMRANERYWRTDAAITEALTAIFDTMQNSIDRGCEREGFLPGKLGVKRRARVLKEQLLAQQRDAQPMAEQYDCMNWLNLYAMAVNEENAAGSRIVTAPTNGAAGIIPAVLTYYLNFYPQARIADVPTFLLTAGAIAILYKSGASISGAEVGCQGEVGVASSMAAGALAAVMGGQLDQIEVAAEIAMEHHLGMTCDPVGGLVQIPCIERNAMGAVKAVNAARLAMIEPTQHKKVSLDKVIATMHQTGKDMKTHYKETSLAGLAVNVVAC